MKKLALLVLSTLSGVMMAAEPLKQAGKQTLYQRILSTPTCELSEQAGGKGKAIPAFSRYYVYERQNVAGNEWLQVGPDEFGKTVGWLNGNCTVAWNIQMTLTFTNPANRDPLLFFKDRSSLENIVNASNKLNEVATIRQQLKRDGSSPMVVAQEPDTFIDFTKNFYLLPILQGEEVMNNDGFYERLLEVASVSKKSTQAVGSNVGSAKVSSSNEDNEVTDFKAAVVFVIDSTISMDPYINRTREAIKRLYDQIEKDGLQEQVKFGLIAFRSSTQAVPGLEYTTKVFVDPSTVKDGKDFIQKAQSLRQAKVSSKEFSEDAYAGIDTALKSVNWNEFGGRYIVLITDAGAIDGDNPISTTGLNAQQIRLEAERKGIAMYALHLKTPSGVKNHEQAMAQYNELSFNKFVNKSLYYPVNAGDVNEFGNKVGQLAQALSAQVKLAYKGEEAVGSALGADASVAKNEIEEDAALLGKAMQLAYLGRKNGQVAPPVFSAWISDRDFAKSDVPTAEVRVLLTKAQLSDLSEVVKKIKDAATSGLVSSSEMFNQLRSIAAAMGQDPSKVTQGASTKIADLNLLGEYLDGIPYKSQITSIDEDAWRSMGAQQQEKFMRDLDSKLRAYRRFNAEVDSWISLAEGSDPKDFVYPVPLEALP